MLVRVLGVVEYTSFDILGRVTGHKQTTDGVGYETEYAYNLSGAMLEQRYPSGRVVKNVLDASGDLSMVQSARCMDAAAGTDADCAAQAGLWNYGKNFTYNPAGAATSMQLGNGRFTSVDPLTASGSAAAFPVFFFSSFVVREHI